MGRRPQRLRFRNGPCDEHSILLSRWPSHGAFDNGADFMFVWSADFTLQQCAKLIAKRLQFTDFVIDFR